MVKNHSPEHSPIIAETAILVMVIDLQEKLVQKILQHESMLHKVRTLLKFCQLVSLPMLATEHNPRGLGRTVRPVLEMLSGEDPILDKSTFSCMKEPEIRRYINSAGKNTIIISGIETHICVQQTVMDLLGESYRVQVLADCIGSRSQLDHETALARMRARGAEVSTLEAFMFEVLTSCRHPLFKRFLNEIVK